MNPPLARTRRRFALFTVTVLLPVLLASVYYGLLASDVYVSESRFVVRSPERGSATGLAALLQGSALGRAQDDTFSVIDFIESRDALALADRKLGVRAAYSGAHIDWLSRFPGPRWWDQSFEALYLYYLDHVKVDYNSSTSVSTLTVRVETEVELL